MGAAALLLLLLPGCSRTAPPHDAAIRSSIGRGLDCVGGLYDGDSFRDDYLEYEYPGEAIESPLAGHRLTYRILDAYFIVLMIRQAGLQPAAGDPLFERAEAVRASLVPSWRNKGIYNLRRNPASHGGIALDTYAILAVLSRDAQMGKVVEAGLDGDGWLPGNFYDGDEAFRRLADESWAARAVLVVNSAKGRERVREICDQVLRAMASEPDATARANLLIHALEAMSDLPRGADGGSASVGAEKGATVLRLRDAAMRLLGNEAIRSDTITLANLAGALILDGQTPCRALAPFARALKARQNPDGCWLASADSTDTSVRVFATLRVVLTLQRFESLCAASR